MQIIKFTHKILNNKETYFFKNMLTNDRQLRKYSENKVGMMADKYGLKTNEQTTYIYKAFSLYNSIPRELSLITNGTIFNKWIKKYYLDKKIK